MFFDADAPSRKIQTLKVQEEAEMNKHYLVKTELVGGNRMPEAETNYFIKKAGVVCLSWAKKTEAVNKEQMNKDKGVSNSQVQEEEIACSNRIQKAEVVCKDQIQNKEAVSNNHTLKKVGARNLGLRMQKEETVINDQMQKKRATRNKQTQMKLGASKVKMLNAEIISNDQVQKKRAKRQKTEGASISKKKRKAEEISNDQMQKKGAVGKNRMPNKEIVSEIKMKKQGAVCNGLSKKSEMSSVQEKCHYCDKSFNRSCNLTRHLLKVHKMDNSGLAVVDNVRSECSYCGKSYSYPADLKRHLHAIHFYSSNEAKFYKCSKCSYVSRYGKTNLTNHMKTHESGKRAKSNASETGCVKCPSCNRTFLAWRNLKVHQKICHLMKNRLEKFKKICAVCSVPLYEHHLEGIFMHYEKDHGVELKWENHTFNSMVELLDWKKRTENETTSFYALCGSLNEKSFSYRCHRSGVYRKTGSNKRHLKLKGSCKINAFCPSIIKVRKKESVLVVDYLSTHIGHENDLKHIPLSLEERILIAKKLSENVTSNEILKNVRESGEISKTQRISLVKKKDINNIKQSLTLGKIAIPPDENLNKSVDFLDMGKTYVESLLCNEFEISVVPHLDYEYFYPDNDIEMNPMSETKDNSENIMDCRIGILKEKCKEIETLIHSKITSHSQVDYLERSFTKILSTINNWDESKGCATYE